MTNPLSGRTASFMRVLAAASVALAADAPAFKPGKWQYDRTMTGPGGSPQRISRTECADPTAKQKSQCKMLAAAGCRFTPTEQSGNSHRFTATCTIGGATSTSTSVLEARSPEAYTVTVDSTGPTGRTHEVLVARRVGDC